MMRLIRGAAEGPRRLDEADARRLPGADDLAPLLRHARSGDAVAMRTLLNTVGPALLRVIRRVLGGNYPDVSDVLQEAFLGFVQALPEFRGHCTVRHFACRIGVFTALVARRRDRTRQRWTDQADFEE